MDDTKDGGGGVGDSGHYHDITITLLAINGNDVVQSSSFL